MHKYISNSSWTMGASVINSAVGFLVVAFVARELGPDGYGVYSYVFAIALLFGMLGHLGIDGLLIRELVKEPDSHPEILGTVFVLKSTGYLAATTAMIAYGFFAADHSLEEKWLFIAASLTIIVLPIPAIISGWFRARVEAKFPALASIIITLFAGIFKVSVLTLGMGVVAVGFSQVAAVAIGAIVIVSMFVFSKGPLPNRWQFSKARGKALLGEGWMIFAGSVFAIVYLKIDQIMLRWFEGTASVGIYSVASTLSEFSYFIPAAIVTTIFPRLVEIYETEKSSFDVRLQEVFDVLALAGYVTLLALLIAVPIIIPIAFGERFTASIGIFIIHVFALPFVFARNVVSRWILIKKLAHISASTQGAGAAMNILLNFMLIPIYGGTGAAIATVASYATASYFSLLIIPETRPVFKMISVSLLKPWRGLFYVRKYAAQIRGEKIAKL